MDYFSTHQFMKKAFLTQAEETENLISELARAIGGERALIEECGNLLSKTYTTQVRHTSILLIMSTLYVRLSFSEVPPLVMLMPVYELFSGFL